MAITVPQEFIVYLEKKEPVPFEVYAQVINYIMELGTKLGRPRKYKSAEEARHANYVKCRERLLRKKNESSLILTII